MIWVLFNMCFFHCLFCIARVHESSVFFCPFGNGILDISREAYNQLRRPQPWLIERCVGDKQTGRRRMKVADRQGSRYIVHLH